MSSTDFTNVMHKGCISPLLLCNINLSSGCEICTNKTCFVFRACIRASLSDDNTKDIRERLMLVATTACPICYDTHHEHIKDILRNFVEPSRPIDHTFFAKVINSLTKRTPILPIGRICTVSYEEKNTSPCSRRQTCYSCMSKSIPKGDIEAKMSGAHLR